MSEITLADFAAIQVGDHASITKTTSDETVRIFAELTGDFNPLHVNQEFAAQSMFGKRLVHGAFSSGLISTVIGMKLPGPGALYLDQFCKFKKPVFIGDILTATATVLDKIVKTKEGKPPMQLLVLETLVTNQDGVVVTEGKATVMVL